MNNELNLSQLLNMIPSSFNAESKYKGWKKYESADFKSMQLVGSLKMGTINNTPLETDLNYWSDNYPISFSHYPNANVEIYTDGNDYYMMYKDFGGHIPEIRCRLIQKHLISDNESQEDGHDSEENLSFSTKFNADETYLKEFEEKYHITIPAAYKSFLLQYGGGVPVQDSYKKDLESGKTIDIEISAFYGNSGDTTLDLGFYYMMTLGVIPRGLMPFADDGIGNHICIGHSGEYLDKIYMVWETEEEELSQVEKLEDNFSDFITRLA